MMTMFWVHVNLQTALVGAVYFFIHYWGSEVLQASQLDFCVYELTISLLNLNMEWLYHLKEYKEYEILSWWLCKMMKTSFLLVVCFMRSLTLARSSTMCFVMTSEEFGVLNEYIGGSSLQSGDCHLFWLIFCSFLAGCDPISGDAYYFGNRGSNRAQKGIILHLSNIWKRDMEFHFVKILTMVLSADRSILLVT